MLIRCDSGSGTRVPGMADQARPQVHSVGFTMTDEVAEAIGKIAARAWTADTTATAASATAATWPS